MWRIVDIAQPDRSLSLHRAAIQVSARGQEIARIPIRDTQALLIHGHGATLSLNLGAALAEAGVPVVLCAANHAPVSILLPVSGNFELAARLQSQVAASRPLAKRFWARLVREKITAQAQALRLRGHVDAKRLETLARSVRGGDPENIEAQAARLYWTRMLGPDFRRDREADGANAALNYGYAVLRAAMSRAVVACGLSPALGLHHRSRLNAFQLVDDLMEPFRPLVDNLVAGDRTAFDTPLEAEAKAQLAAVSTLRLEADDGAFVTVARAMDQLCATLCAVYRGEAKHLWRPRSWMPARQQGLDIEVVPREVV